MRIFDQIIAVDATAVVDIQSLQQGLTSAVQATRERDPSARATVNVLVLRHPDPTVLGLFRLALKADNDLKIWHEEQVTDSYKFI